LKNAAPADVASGMQHDDADVKESELDRGGFDAEKYVREVLERESLEGVLRVEAGLISGVWSIYPTFHERRSTTGALLDLRAD